MEKSESTELFHGFDSHWYVETLEKSGIPSAQAKAHLQVSKEVMMNIFANVATKQDLLLIQQEMLLMKKDMNEIKGDLIKWNIGTMFGLMTLFVAGTKLL
jgi:hypothetical protein